MFVFKYVIVFLVFSSELFVSGEVFSSISAMEPLVSIQGEMLKFFDDYMKKEEESLKQMKLLIASFKLEYKNAKLDPAKYVSNPINSFRLIKQLYRDWSGITELMNRATQDFQNKVATLKSKKVFPDENDMTGSAEGFLRLQTFYELDVREIAEGVLKGVKCSRPLTSNDCFEIGVAIHNTQSYNAAQKWFTAALEKFKPEEYVPYNLTFVLEYAAHNEYMRGDIEAAQILFEELQRIHPENTNLQGYLEQIQNIKNNETALANMKIKPDPVFGHEYPIYKALCREDLDRPNSYKKLLKCRYLTTHRPFTKIAPFKVEEHYLHPYLIVYHDIVYDTEIEYFMNEVKPTIRRSEVISNKETVVVKSRVSMNSWLANKYSPIVDRVNERLADMTGLNMEFAESIQFANYGLGGHYGPHFDCTLRKENVLSNDPRGNRLATLLVYMTDVEEGGNTVFPELGVSVRPVKGTAVFWYNLHPSGEGNLGTLHGACPVLKGSKWVLNKWVRLVGNEFVIPCNLKYQDEGKCSQYPAPVPTKENI